MDIAQLRLHNQHLAAPRFKKAAEIVKWLGAVQSQDYPNAKWALGQRLLGATDDDIEQAFNAGEILRTHVMRPTWHFVAPTDIHWLLKLTSPRVNTALGSNYRNHELDETVFRRSNKVLAAALKGGNQLTRNVLGNVLQQAGISTAGLRLILLLARAELDGVICSGARIGKQFTYALLEERAPEAKPFNRDEALAELTERYFTSHGPATSEDFAWWSGLTAADVRKGLEMVQSKMTRAVIAGKTYWFRSTRNSKSRAAVANLLPAFDEYLVAYKDRSAVLDPLYKDQAGWGLGPSIAFRGQVVGSWKRSVGKKLTVKLEPFSPLSKTQQQSVMKSCQRFGEFLGMTPVIE